MIHFHNPPLGDSLSSDDLEMSSSLPKKYADASRAVGFVIHMGNELCETGFDEIRHDFYPYVRDTLQSLCHPRIILGFPQSCGFQSKTTVFINSL